MQIVPVVHRSGLRVVRLEFLFALPAITQLHDYTSLFGSHRRNDNAGAKAVGTAGEEACSRRLLSYVRGAGPCPGDHVNDGIVGGEIFQTFLWTTWNNA